MGRGEDSAERVAGHPGITATNSFLTSKRDENGLERSYLSICSRASCNGSRGIWMKPL
jgi:hypothetical protein